LRFFFQGPQLLRRVRFLPADRYRLAKRERVRENRSSSDSSATKVKSDADELLILFQSIHSGVNSVGKGMLPKDLIDKLTQMEKLSKRLRNETP
jgi:hypothetical protein